MTRTGIIKNMVNTYMNGYSLFLIEYSAKALARNIGTREKGHQMIIPEILNIKCENATTTALIFPVARDARIAVIVVPIFAPKVYGKIWARVNIPAPAIGTTKLVVIELL
jgi:hypothetical protein